MHPELESVPEQLQPLDEITARILGEEFEGLLAGYKISSPQFSEFLRAVFNLSPYLKDCAFKEADFIVSTLERGFDESLENVLTETRNLGLECHDEAELMKRIRFAKRRVALICGLADLGGWWNGDRVTLGLSEFASASLSACLDFILLENHRSEKLILKNPRKPQKGSGFIVLGMGKLGAGELNYSSDIDLIFIFDDTAPIQLNTDDPITLLSRMAKKYIRLMQDRTSDGYVFRMDLRLRPDPSSTPLVIPLVAALNYYEGQGQNWERAAMIKARPVAGDMVAGQSFLRELQPFIWRKYLDFAAINDVQSIKRQIHAHKGHGKIAVLGHNVKLGRGGIREIEFFAQTQQLIAGGRNTDLRSKETISALQSLYDNKWIEASALQELSAAYWFLRDLEHRLQMVDDIQTHTLPDAEKDLQRIANMSGVPDIGKFSSSIRETLKTVERHYSELFETADDLGSQQGNLVFTGDDEDPDTIITLSKMGFQRPGDVIKIIKSWHVAKIAALRATQARQLLTELAPEILTSFATANNPDEVLYKFDRFISGLPAGIQLFSILKTNPSLFELLIKILSAAPRLAEQISHKPHVFDAMIDPQFGKGEVDRQSLQEILNAGLSRASDYEAKLDEARRFLAQTRFMIGCQCFAGTLSVQKTAMAFSILAEIIIETMLDVVKTEFSFQHGSIDGEKFCILAMGRLGSCELTATSDLDLIFLYDFDPNREESNGVKPLPASLYFIRLMQRFISAMSSPTSEGKLFELDFRLRPSGNAGPLATHIDAFIKYQQEKAWVWETQALTRARPVAGNGDLCKTIEAAIPQILQQRDDSFVLKKEISKMRRLVEKEKGVDNVWDLKNVSGGLLDIEFIAQFLAIKNGTNEKTGTRSIILDQRHTDISQDQRDLLLSAFDTYNTVLQLQRICIGETLDTEKVTTGFIEIVCSSMDMPDMGAAEANLKSLQYRVRTIFNSIMKS